jgi:serine/alanine adding enzyme
VQVVQSLPEASWRRFVDAHTESNIFHTPEMFEVFARARHHEPTLWAVVADSERVLALLLPVRVTLFGRLQRLTTRSIAYGSILLAPGPEGEEALALLLQTYKHKMNGTPLFTELRNLSNLAAAQPVLRQHGFVYQQYLNYLIDLSRPPDLVFEDIGSRTRKHIRRGLRKGEVVVEEATEAEQIAAGYELLCRTYQRARVPLADRSLFEAAFQLLHPRGMIRFTQASVRDQLAAVSVELLYKDVVYGWYGGVDRVYSRYVPNELLTWHILDWGARNGYRCYDFGGAGRADERYGVRDFKAKFGGDLVEFGRNVCVHTPALLYVSQCAYAAFRLFCRVL